MDNRQHTFVIMAQLLVKFPSFDPGWPDAIKADWFKGFDQFMAYARQLAVGGVPPEGPAEAL